VLGFATPSYIFRQNLSVEESLPLFRGMLAMRFGPFLPGQTTLAVRNLQDVFYTRQQLIEIVLIEV
jgi:hypothetical protein